MPYPLVILGAGASFDYLDRDDLAPPERNRLEVWRSPLANDLFNYSRFHEVINRHKVANSLITQVKSAIKRGQDIETYLTHLKDEVAEKNDKISKQIVSLLFYLRDLFQTVSEQYYSPDNHYKHLFQVIDQNFEGKACFVNFNYDLLLEKSLEEHTRYDDNPFSSSSLPGYIARDIKIVKIHGSCNWVYEDELVSNSDLDTSENHYVENHRNVFSSKIKRKIALSAQSLPSDKNTNLTKIGGGKKVASLPALALPIQSKNNFVCPDEHIQALKDFASQSDIILIIGWRARDPYLISLLSEVVAKKEKIIAMIGGDQVKEEVFDMLGPTLKGSVKIIFNEGFSKFMGSDVFERLVKNS